MLKDNIGQVNQRIKEACKACGADFNKVTVIAATKTVPAERIGEMLPCGIKTAGENRVQELLSKYEKVNGIDWHFIGALQTNKVKYIIDKVSLIHSADRASLIDEISRQAQKHNITANILIEVNAGEEKTKSGVHIKDLDGLVKDAVNKPNIMLKGFMSVLPIDADDSLYKAMNGIFIKYKAICPQISVLSMGMSDDYEKAILNGANMVRLGSALFGRRTV